MLGYRGAGPDEVKGAPAGRGALYGGTGVPSTANIAALGRGCPCDKGGAEAGPLGGTPAIDRGGSRTTSAKDHRPPGCHAQWKEDDGGEQIGEARGLEDGEEVGTDGEVPHGRQCSLQGRLLQYTSTVAKPFGVANKPNEPTETNHHRYGTTNFIKV
jgi:hypothetical protein